MLREIVFLDVRTFTKTRQQRRDEPVIYMGPLHFYRGAHGCSIVAHSRRRSVLTILMSSIRRRNLLQPFLATKRGRRRKRSTALSRDDSRAIYIKSMVQVPVARPL